MSGCGSNNLPSGKIRKWVQTKRVESLVNVAIIKWLGHGRPGGVNEYSITASCFSFLFFFNLAKYYEWSTYAYVILNALLKPLACASNGLIVPAINLLSY